MKKEELVNVVPSNMLTILNTNRKLPDEAFNTRELVENLDTTYSYTTKILNNLENAGLVVRSVEGRSKRIFFTDKGEELAEAFETIDSVLESVNE